MKMFKSSFFAFMLVALAIFMSSIVYADISQTSIGDKGFAYTVDNDVGSAGITVAAVDTETLEYCALCLILSNGDGFIIYESPPPSKVIATYRIEYKESYKGSFVNEIDVSRDRPSVVIRI